jgi:predicted dinucleotide-binding enzyme
LVEFELQSESPDHIKFKELLMKIGVLGTGVVGQTLGTALVGLGHEVKMGSRTPGSQKVHDWVSKNGAGATAGSFDEAAAFGKLLILATLWEGTEHALSMTEATHFVNKVVVDVTNPLHFNESGPVLALGFSESGGEKVQAWLPQSHVVKALNSVTANLMANPQQILGETPDMLICGNDDEAKSTVTALLTSLGWSTVDMGGIQESRLLEPLAMLWIKHMMRTRNWQHAFKLIKK